MPAHELDLGTIYQVYLQLKYDGAAHDEELFEEVAQYTGCADVESLGQWLQDEEVRDGSRASDEQDMG